MARVAIAVACAAALHLAAIGDGDVEELAPRHAHLFERSALGDLAGAVDLVLESVRRLLVEEVGDGLDLAITDGARALPLRHVALRAAVARMASDGVLARVGGAVLVEVLVAGARGGLVALRPDVVDRLVAMSLRIGEAVLRVPRGARRAEPRVVAVALAAGISDHVLPRVVVLEALEILVGLHLREAGANRRLLRVAVVARGAGHEAHEKCTS